MFHFHHDTQHSSSLVPLVSEPVPLFTAEDNRWVAVPGGAVVATGVSPFGTNRSVQGSKTWGLDTRDPIDRYGGGARLFAASLLTDREERGGLAGERTATEHASIPLRE